MSLAITPAPLPLVPALAQRPSMPNDINRLLAAQRLALLGYSRQINSPLVPSTTHANPLSTQALKAAMQSSFDSTFAKLSTNPQPPSQSVLSSVARRKQQIANNSVASYALGITSDTVYTSPAPSSSHNESNSTQSSRASLNRPVLAPVGVVDMQFLTRQPPAVQKPSVEKQPKSASKESSVGTPTSPSAPLAAGPAPKNQRPKSTARPVAAAATNGKSTSSIATASNGGNKSDTVDKDALKSKHAFLFRPESQQPTSGPYVRYSPMYHYYHPYRNLHREAIKDEWMRLHPVVERMPPPEEEEVVTPPRRTSGRQKKTNVRGVAARGRADKTGKKGAAATAAAASQGNDVVPASPQLANSRRSRTNAAKSKNSGAKAGAKKGGRATGNAANKRKRADLEEEDKQIGGKDEAIPVPPPKRPRRGAAALAAIATAEAAREAEEAGSNKDEASPTEAQDDGEPKTTVKRRMRPNARKTAAARAAAMEAKKQKKRSTEDGEASEDNGEEEGALESLKDDESVSKPDGSQKGDTPGADLDMPVGVEKDDALGDVEHQVEAEVDQDVESERKTKPTRGKGGFGAARGPRAKTKRGGFGAQKRVPGLTINTRGTPRGTPKQVPVDDETGSLPPDPEETQIQNAPVGRRNTRKAAPTDSALCITVNAPAKPKRIAGGGRRPRQDLSALAQLQDSNSISQEDSIAVDPMLIAEDAMSVSQHAMGDVEHEPAAADDDRLAIAPDYRIPTKQE